jgi:hypothetical protein
LAAVHGGSGKNCGAEATPANNIAQKALNAQKGGRCFRFLLHWLHGFQQIIREIWSQSVF